MSSGFEKEASLLNSTKGHRNIIRFLEFSIMMEYSCFDVRPFGVAKSLCTLENFVHFVDDGLCLVRRLAANMCQRCCRRFEIFAQQEYRSPGSSETGRKHMADFGLIK